jgi:hypothetical protein
MEQARALIGKHVKVSVNPQNRLIQELLEVRETPAPVHTGASPPESHAPATTQESEEDYDLARSATAVGELYPILVGVYDKGKVVDGFHRKKVNPNWRVEVLPWVKTKRDYLVARIVANTHRRHITAEERQHDMTDLAEFLFSEDRVFKGDIVKQIAETTGFTERYVRRLLPDRYKMTERQREGGPSPTATKKGVPSDDGDDRENVKVIAQSEAQEVKERDFAELSSANKDQYIAPPEPLSKEERMKQFAETVRSAPAQPVSDLYISPCPWCGKRVRWAEDKKRLMKVE